MKEETLKVILGLSVILAALGLGAWGLHQSNLREQAARNWRDLNDRTNISIENQHNALKEARSVQQEHEDWIRGSGLGGIGNHHEEVEPASWLRQNQKETTHPDFRRVNGQLYNIRRSTNWHNHDGRLAAVQDDLTIVDIGPRAENRWIAARNLVAMTPGGNTYRPTSARAEFTFRALRVGTTEWNHVTVQLWDCGIPATAPGLQEAIKPKQPKQP